MSSLIDTHCHIHAASKNRQDYTAKKWHESGLTDPGALAKSAFESGVSKLICVGTSLDDSISAVDFAQAQENCWAAVGVHPHDAKNFLLTHKSLESFEPLANEPKVVAIGEVGLDYYHEHSPKTEQIKLLEMFLDMAQKQNVPLIFHVRDAYQDFWPVLANFPNMRGVLHSFTDSLETLEKALKNDLYIGLNGIMTFTRDNSQLEAAKALPLNKLMVETDAPYLAPKPFRGKVCKPEYIKSTAEFLCELRNETFEQFADKTSQNADRLFKLD